MPGSFLLFTDDMIISRIVTPDSLHIRGMLRLLKMSAEAFSAWLLKVDYQLSLWSRVNIFSLWNVASIFCHIGNLVSFFRLFLVYREKSQRIMNTFSLTIFFAGVYLRLWNKSTGWIKSPSVNTFWMRVLPQRDVKGKGMSDSQRVSKKVKLWAWPLALLKLKLGIWPHLAELGFDEAQFQAYQAALTEEFVLIQGPPCTGKTFLGRQLILKIVDAVLYIFLGYTDPTPQPIN